MNSKQILTLLAPALFIIILLLPDAFFANPEAKIVLAVAAWMIIWWVSESVELPITALLPIILFPLLGVSKIEEVTKPYSDPIIYLFMGGFVIALALEKWNLHLRIALNIVRVIGTHADGIILGFMLATGFLSMWISNTATTVMMLPIAQSVVKLMLQNKTTLSKGEANFALCMMLGVAYAANIGGIGTLVGTPPNVVMAGFLSKTYQFEIGFGRWMAIGFPFATVLLLVSFLLMVKVFYPNGLGKFTHSSELIDGELQKLGKMQKAEILTLVIFVTTALLWILREYLQQFLPSSIKLHDATIAMLATIAFFLTPTGLGKNKFLLHWSDTQKLPWGILLLFGGGMSLAEALSKTGITQIIGIQAAQWGLGNPTLVIAVLSLVALFLTEIMSNVALVTVFMPVVSGIAIGMGIEPVYLCLPITIAASCAFMLPMGTPPNAIVFASGYIKVSQMVKVGFWLNIISIIILMLLVKLLMPYLF
ncbi:MAG: DASS family sodium-coupled anion symporter [Cytophagales bacterium]|nr:MAG: DASS family sodium-coupled anion symporter [Cytophagales bacterium]